MYSEPTSGALVRRHWGVDPEHARRGLGGYYEDCVDEAMASSSLPPFLVQQARPVIEATCRQKAAEYAAYEEAAPPLAAPAPLELVGEEPVPVVSVNGEVPPPEWDPTLWPGFAPTPTVGPTIITAPGAPGAPAPLPVTTAGLGDTFLKAGALPVVIGIGALALLLTAFRSK